MNIKSEILRHDTTYETNNNGGPIEHLQIGFMCSSRLYIYKCIVRVRLVNASFLNGMQLFFTKIFNESGMNEARWLSIQFPEYTCSKFTT